MLLARKRPWVLRIASLLFPVIVLGLTGYIFYYYGIEQLAVPLFTGSAPVGTSTRYAIELAGLSALVVAFLTSFAYTVLTHAGSPPPWFAKLYSLPQWHDIFLDAGAHISAGQVQVTAGGRAKLLALAGIPEDVMDSPDLAAAYARKPNQRAPAASEAAVHAGVRWCAHCNAPKPLRSHHCTAMGECILRYDHYCPWVANAIGYYNYKFFVLFVTYGFLAATWVSLGLVPVMVTRHNLGGGEVAITWGASMAWVLALSFACALLLFSAMHWWFVGVANTSVEATFRRARNPFDHGSRNNFNLVFGAIPSFWPRCLTSLDTVLATAGGTYIYQRTVTEVWAAAATAREAAHLPPLQGAGASARWGLVDPDPEGGSSGDLWRAGLGVFSAAPAQNTPPGGATAPRVPATAAERAGLLASGATEDRDSDESVDETHHASELLWHGSMAFDHRWWWWRACGYNPARTTLRTGRGGPMGAGTRLPPAVPEFLHPRIWQRLITAAGADGEHGLVELPGQALPPHARPVSIVPSAPAAGAPAAAGAVLPGDPVDAAPAGAGTAPVLDKSKLRPSQWRALQAKAAASQRQAGRQGAAAVAAKRAAAGVDEFGLAQDGTGL